MVVTKTAESETPDDPRKQGRTAGHQCDRCDAYTEYIVTQQWRDPIGVVDWRRCPECYTVYFPPRSAEFGEVTPDE